MKYFCRATLASVVPRRGRVADPGIAAAVRCHKRQPGIRQCDPHGLRQWNADRGASRIVDDDRFFTRAIGVVEQQCRPDFADCGGIEILIPGRKQDGVLVDEISGVVLVEITENRIPLDEGRHTVGRARDRKASINCVAEYPCVAQGVTGGKARRIGHREGRKQ